MKPVRISASISVSKDEVLNQIRLEAKKKLKDTTISFDNNKTEIIA